MGKIKLACIIDDDPTFVFVVKRNMAAVDFCEHCIYFENGFDAISALRKMVNNDEDLPNVVLLDLNMPIMDGWDFLDEFVTFKFRHKIIIYVISSSINPEDELRARQYEDVNNFIVKPINIEKLQDILQDLLKG